MVVESTAVAGAVKTTAPRQRPRRLRVAQIAWGIMAVVDAVLFIGGVPGLYSVLHQPCIDGATIFCSEAQAPLADFQILQRNGLVGTFATFNLSIVVLTSLVFFAVGGLIARRKWHDPMGLFVSIVLITFGATGISDMLQVPFVAPLDFLNPIIDPLGPIVTLLQYPALAIFLLTFPNGRFAPRWTWVLVLLWIVQLGLFFMAAPDIILLASVLSTWGGTGLVQIYRYRRVYTPLERQQTKWVVFSLAFIAVPSQIVSALLPVLWPSLDTPGSIFRITQIVWLALFWMPVSVGVGIAILRARLYDIDLLINRALVYGTLTIVLALVYVAGVVGSQAIIGGITHSGTDEQPPIAVVLTTLVIAALFQPARHRIQATIDRRFYRRKYDAARTIAAFAHTLREEVELHDLADHLLAAVGDTMQPTHASLWLRQSERIGGDRTTGAGAV